MFDSALVLAEYLVSIKVIDDYSYSKNVDVNEREFIITINNSTVITKLHSAYWYMQGLVDAYKKLKG